ncbi:hypothetical protein E2C01_090366 [Portunus trituberculatus]|uniref:Uncharacterized protein n=1 Tax=Portunus trituberculatus TaxID=210409 RepID=A0A5B7JQ49_PORTR|nr:hypothetical protein [Portunus trituberculatus]
MSISSPLFNPCPRSGVLSLLLPRWSSYYHGFISSLAASSTWLPFVPSVRSRGQEISPPQDIEEGSKV